MLQGEGTRQRNTMVQFMYLKFDLERQSWLVTLVNVGSMDCPCKDYIGLQILMPTGECIGYDQ